MLGNEINRSDGVRKKEKEGKRKEIGENRA
jgi:hypothetical protein